LAAGTTGGWNWERIYCFNIGGPYNVFEASKQNDVRRIIFASSGGTMLGYEMENPYTEIVGADYDKIPET
jgi:nucleoside-diphosphate-sugar epimerase